MSKLNNKKNSEKHKKDVERANAEAIANKMKEISVVIKVKAGDNGKIFGGVTSKEISENLKTQYNIDVDKKKIVLKETIKVLGTVNVDIKLYEGVLATLKVNTVA